MNPSNIYAKTERLYLRDLCSSDLDAVHSIVGDPLVTHSLSFDARSRAESQEIIRGAIARSAETPRREYYLAIAINGPMIGFARLGLNGVNAAKLGCAIQRSFWGKGYAFEAAHALVSYGFGDLGLHRISAAIGPDNHASIRVVQKLGFEYEGTLRDHVYTNSAWRASRLYSIISQTGSPSHGE